MFAPAICSPSSRAQRVKRHAIVTPPDTPTPCLAIGYRHFANTYILIVIVLRSVMTRKGALTRTLYIRINQKWIDIGSIGRDGGIRLRRNVDTILKEAFE